ncbi:MAG TPA: DUF1810 domain-containing protein [Candidatus Saccharimonadales bacterium]|nr:DUF1810 domain-containing protein [Candidatus Saccharimonadales bacterium]
MQRFVDAQEPVYERVLDELRAGSKRTHWMWFIFPQIAGLGRSAMSVEFAITSLAEATAYLAHPLLGARLRDCSALMLATAGRSAEAILGRPDDAKFHSSLTLFAQVHPTDPVFAACLEKYFAGRPDPHTLSRL